MYRLVKVRLLYSVLDAALRAPTIAGGAFFFKQAPA